MRYPNICLLEKSRRDGSNEGVPTYTLTETFGKLLSNYPCYSFLSAILTQWGSVICVPPQWFGALSESHLCSSLPLQNLYSL